MLRAEWFVWPMLKFRRWLARALIAALLLIPDREKTDGEFLTFVSNVPILVRSAAQAARRLLRMDGNIRGFWFKKRGKATCQIL